MLFHCKVENFSTARYAFEFNVIEGCITVVTLNICEENNNSRCFKESF